MKGVSKWFIAFLILSGLVVPSFLTCSVVNAKQYTISTLPLTVPNVSYSADNIASTSPPYSFYFVSSDDYNDVDLYRNWVFNASSSDNNDACLGRSFRKFPIISNLSNNRTSFNYSYRGYDNNWSVPFNVDPCGWIQPTLPINNSSLVNLVPSEDADDILEMPPYRVHSSGIYRTDHMADNGLNYDTKFDLLYDVFGVYSANYPSKIFSLTIPFGPSPVPLNNGTPIEFNGEYTLTFDNPNGGLDHVDFTLDIVYLTQQNSSSTRHSACTSSLTADDPSDPYSVYSLKYSCPYTLGSDFSSYDPSTTFVYFTLSSTWTYDDNVSNVKLNALTFESAISVTDNDYTPGGEWGVPIIGSKPDSSLGSASRNPSASEPNFFSSFLDLFNFGSSLINPFTPIFGLFANNESCTQIPTIAGMIHSEEQTVCPWFDSSTRNIVTPVLGIVSMMLLFGFVVRWLGARSGNFFEDTTDETIGRHSSLNNGWGRRGK